MEPDTRNLGRLLCALVVVSVALGAAGAVAAAPDRPEGITTVNYTGPAVIGTYNNTTYAWSSENGTLNVTVLPIENGTEHTVCVRRHPVGSSGQKLGCQSRTIDGVAARYSFAVPQYPNNSTGPWELSMTLDASNRTSTSTLPVQVVNRTGDEDGDGLSNEAEQEAGTDLTRRDTDGDGLDDFAEVDDHQSDPTKVDTDGDGLDDGYEVRQGTDPTKVDTDGDGLSDAVELANDGFDPTVVDTDYDGLDDAAEYDLGSDPTTADTDDDGLDDKREARLGTDPTKVDTDGDGFPDAQEVRWGTDPTDSLSPLAWIGALALVLLLAVAAGAWYVQTRTDADPVGTVGAWVRSPPPESGAPDAGDEADRDYPLPGDPESAARSSTDGGGPGSNGGGTAADAELVPPEERVLQLLEEHGGQIRQTKVVEETDWSKAKVSRVLSRMEEEGQVDRYRIGRGNVVTQPGEDLTVE